MIGIGIKGLALTRIANAIKALFAAGEVGVWYDPSDLTTMFQDSAGTTPVTAVEQPVGLILDKSKGLTLGAELVTNGGFDTVTTNWNASIATLSVVSGKLRITNTTTGSGSAHQAITTTVGKSYVCSYSTGDVSSALLRFRVGTAPEGSQNLSLSPSANTTGSGFFVATATTTYITPLAFNSGGAAGTYADFDNISVRELPGRHSKQATAAARPALKAAPSRIDYDAVDDTLVATFAANLGTDCTVCRAVPSVGVSILTGQTIGTTYTDNTDHCGLIIVNRALTAGETSSVTAYLNAKAGV